MLKILLRFVPEFSSDMCTHIHTHAHTRICVYTHPLRRAHNDATFSSLKCLPAFVTVFASTFSFFFHSPSLSLRLFSPLSAASCRCSSLLLPLVLLPISVILASPLLGSFMFSYRSRWSCRWLPVAVSHAFLHLRSHTPTATPPRPTSPSPSPSSSAISSASAPTGQTKLRANKMSKHRKQLINGPKWRI